MIQLFTDSAANLPMTALKENNIEVVPFSYTADGTEMTEFTKDFDGKAYYDDMRAGTIVKTSMINSALFTEYFERELSRGCDVLYIGMSGGISGTAGAALAAAQELAEKYPDREIAVVDTLGASLGEGMLVLEAAKMIRGGAGAKEIARQVRAMIPTMCQCFTVDDLNYLKRSGRISGAAALIGGLLGIKPLLLGNEEGKIVMYGKVRGASRALEALAERYERLATDKSLDLGIAHADNEDGAQYLIDRLREKGFSGSCMTVCYEPVTGSHVGPGTVALFFFGSNRVG